MTYRILRKLPQLWRRRSLPPFFSSWREEIWTHLPTFVRRPTLKKSHELLFGEISFWKKGKEWSYFYKEATFWLSGFVTSQKTFKIPNLPPSCLASRASKSPPAKWVPSFESDAHFEVCIEQRKKKPLFQWKIWLKPTLIAQSSPGPTHGILGLITACLFISLAPPARRSQLKRALKTYTTY